MNPHRPRQPTGSPSRAIAPHVRRALGNHRPAFGPNRVVQRSEKVYIKSSKKKRDFIDWFSEKHIREASHYTSYAGMAEEGMSMVQNRQGRNTIFFLNVYQVGLFKDQEHNHVRWDNKWGDIFESTTSFPAVDVLTNGTIQVYSQAKFQYSGDYDEDGVLWINHLFGITQGTLVKTIKPQSQHIVFE